MRTPLHRHRNLSNPHLAWKPTHRRPAPSSRRLQILNATNSLPNVAASTVFCLFENHMIGEFWTLQYQMILQGDNWESYKGLAWRFLIVLRSKPMVPGGWPLIDIGYKYNVRKVLYFIVRTTQVAQRLVFPIYPSILTSLLMFPFALLLVPLLCQIFFCCKWGWLTQQVKKIWFGTGEVVGYSMWLATAMYGSCYGNDYY